MNTEIFILADGKYEIHREHGRLIRALLHGEPWPAAKRDMGGMGVLHAALNEIARLRAIQEPGAAGDAT